MNKKIVNLVAVFVIVIGAYYLSQPQEANAMFAGECCLFTHAECSNCVLVCPDNGDPCKEVCFDGGALHGEARGPIPNPPPPDYPASCS